MHRARGYAALFGGASVTVAMVALACGETYDEAPTGGDAGAGDAAVIPALDGAEAPAARCDPRKPFTKVERVPGVPDNAFCARLDAEESVITFSYGDETRTAVRGADGAFGPATKLPLEKEGKGICLTSSTDRARVYYEEFFNVHQETGSPEAYAAKLSMPREGTRGLGRAYFDESHGLLYADFHIVDDYFKNCALGVATVTGGTTSKFRRLEVGFGIEAGVVNQPDNEPASYFFTGAVPSHDGLALYFGTTRTSVEKEGVADLNVWVATRTRLDEDFGNPAPVAGLNSPDRDAPSWISPDGCRLYFESNRGVTDVWGGNAMYVATRDP